MAGSAGDRILLTHEPLPRKRAPRSADSSRPDSPAPQVIAQRHKALPQTTARPLPGRRRFAVTPPPRRGGAYDALALARPRQLRAAAWGVVVLGAAAPALRRRLRLRKPVVAATAYAAPIALCVAVPRSRRRD